MDNSEGPKLLNRYRALVYTYDILSFIIGGNGLKILLTLN